MRRLSRSRLIAVALGVVILLALSFLLFAAAGSKTRAPSGLSARGKPLEQWVDMLANTGDYEAVDAIREAGISAAPLLREPLQRRSNAANTLWVKLWPKLPPVVQQHFAKPVLASTARMNIVAALRDIPPIARVMIPDLLPRLHDEDGTIRLHTAITMGNIGPDARESIPILRQFLKSDSYTTRIYSARALWKVSGEVEPALSALEAGIRDTKAKFRWAAAVFLGEMGTNALRASPLLGHASKSEDQEVASLAIQALADISTNTVPLLIEHLHSPAPAIRMSAAIALGRM